jgi:REP element-mobilizing transposase RayT
MKSDYNPEIHHRNSIRLRGYDYSSSGAYFVTVCIKNKECLFGEIVDGMMRLNHAGELIHEIWDALPKRYDDIDLDAFVVMPNHVHGIIILTDTPAVGAGLALPSRKGAASSAPTLGDVIRTFKSISTIQVNRLLTRTGQPLWQRNYYEHIIRNETGLDSIRAYIAMNPQNWMMDEENPVRWPAADVFDKAIEQVKRIGQQSPKV